MQPGDILPDGIVEMQFVLLAQFQDRGGGEALRMRGDAKPVPRREFLAAAEIGMAERTFEHDAVAMRDRDDASGLFGYAHLEREP